MELRIANFLTEMGINEVFDILYQSYDYKDQIADVRDVLKMKVQKLNSATVFTHKIIVV